MNEATEVEARFGEDGRISVLSFTWRGRKRPVLSQGRQWGADDGFHFLVMTTGEQIVELVYVPLSGLWTIADTPVRPLSA
jgi:lysylphosphatidylglycerol synthetase-like protein (DUF2156 family)